MSTSEEPIASDDWELQRLIDSEDRMREAIHAAYISVATSTLDRTLHRADSVLRVSGIAGTVYTGILGLIYSANGTHEMTGWSLVPASLFAASLALGATYIGYVGKTSQKFQPLASSTHARVQHQRMADLIGWVNTTALARAWAIRSSIVVLGLGIASMPIAFLEGGQGGVGISAIALAIAWVLGEALASRSK